MKRFIVAAALTMVGATAMVAQETLMSPIPVDEQVRIGKLDNGLTYYIRHNEYPEHVANFYIAQRVGSIQEEENQRGLAHFLEHMAFNGSDHFPGNGIIDFTRSLGVEFGSDLNAYTSIDQTVYRVCNVPTKRITAVDSCLLILKDWSNGLSLEEEEIIKERDVVHNEWRMGEGPQQRMQTRDLEKLYPNSKYGKRLPIGLMSVVDNFKRQELVDYYKKWYRPDNQAIIVVGDIDVDHIEAEIKKLFGGIVVPKDAAQVKLEEVPDNAEAIYVFDKDREMPINQIVVMMKTDATPDEEKNSMAYLMQKYVIDVVSSMFNARLSEMTQEPECPFVQAYAGYGQYLLSKTKDNFELIGIPKEGKDMETISALVREAKRARDFGFTATEFERAKSNYLASLEKQYTNRDKRTNDEYGNDYRDHFLSNEPIPSMEFLYQNMSQSIVPMLPVEVINQVIPEFISVNDSNLVVWEMAREAEGLSYPTEAQMAEAVAKARAEQLTAYVDNAKEEPLMLPENMPKKGKIVKETENKQLGYKELKLSNGATVVLKKTDFKDDEVQLQAFSKGGKSLYGPADFTNLKVFDEVIGYSGLGNFSSSELQKALAGKKCNADPSLAVTRQYMTAHSTPKDLETMFQMLYLYFTNIKKDEKQVQNLMNQLELTLKNKDLQPAAIFQDSLTSTMYAHNPRYTNLQMSDLKNISYDRILEIAKERYKDASQFTFVIVGNFDDNTIRPLLEQYVASLPALKKSKAEKPLDVRTLFKGKVKNNFTVKTDSPNAMSVLMWQAPMPYTLENEVKADAVGQILSQIYLATIREQESAAYTCASVGRFDLAGEPIVRLLGISQGNPEKNARAVELLYKGFNDNMQKIDADAMQKVKEYMIKQADVDAKSNSHWVNVLTTWKDHGIDMQTNYKKVVEALTAESLQQFMKQLTASGNQMECIMMTEPKEDTKPAE